MKTTLALPEVLWEELSATLEDPLETAGFILAGSAADAEETTLFARSIHWIAPDDYILRERNRLTIGSEAIVAALKAAAQDSSVAIFFHSHPGGDPAPSTHDDRVDQQLREPAQFRTDQEVYASLILGGARGAEGFSGRIFIGERVATIDRLRVVGSHLKLLTAETAETDFGRFDRQIRAFGVAGQQTLGEMHVGVVGAGGTGSAVFEMLTRIGVGRVTVIDDDDLTDTNLTRIHESAAADIDKPKVEVAKAAAERIGTGTRVNPVPGKITKLDVARRLRHCDLIFGCTDDHSGRAILSRIAYWYLAPLIDTAFMVDADGQSVRGLFGRVTTVYPGAPCLLCRGRIDLSQASAEALPAAERERLAGEGYVPGLGEPDPSVGAYTTLVASIGLSEMLDRLFGLSGESEPPSELLLRLHDRAITIVEREPLEGHYCAEQTSWGRGDEEPLLGQLWAQPATD